MSAFTKINVSLEDLGMAYRKAKVDLFYSPRECRKQLAEFEAKLETNLSKLKKNLAAGKAPELPAQSWTLVPKGISPNESDGKVINSDPQHLWQTLSQREDLKVEFRLMEALPIDFHVFAALWVQHVGHLFEAKLGKSAYGNRLRRDNSGALNPLSLGSTTPYLHPYCEWRDKGIDSMREALEKDKSIVAITADVRSFYHELDVLFMLDSKFKGSVGVKLTGEKLALHRLFINAMSAWATETPLGKGLPVGLCASSVIANVALFELDQFIERQVTPLYYGRYVDDIILVMENPSDFKASEEVWDWMCQRSGDVLRWQDKDKKELRFDRLYLEGSEIVFANEKNKTFLLSGAAGKSILKSIAQEIQMRTSEWRALPDLPLNSTDIESTLLTAIQSDGVAADSLRKADKISVRRAGFAIKLRDIEAYSRALSPDAWQAQRHAFFSAFTRHILILPTFFDFYNYLARVLTLAISCADFEHLRKMLDALEDMLLQLNECKLSIKAQGDSTASPAALPDLALLFREELKTNIAESIESSFPLRLSRKAYAEWNLNFSKSHTLYAAADIQKLRATHRNYIKRDLASRPLKQILLPPGYSGDTEHSVARKSLGNLKTISAKNLLQNEVITGVATIARMAKLPDSDKLPSGLLFPTRPPSISDLYLLHKRPFTQEGSSEIAEVLLALRGFKPEGKLPEFIGSIPDASKGNPPIGIPLGKTPRDKIRIAVASWKTDIQSCVAAITRGSDPDHSRLARLNDLLNAVLKSRSKPDYLILPELALPAHWFLAVARKLQGKGISLICGVEYLHGPSKSVRNQVWAALAHDALGFPVMMIYRQDKQKPALHEEAELHRIGGRVLKPEARWTFPPIIDHGGFQFAMLICSELTNIAYRADLRGNIDALFVPEWNQDTESFNSLVESAALDIHAYIIQCNDRQYGDSRIRVPHKDVWHRDLIRIKGGMDDYFVVGEVDVKALREFQSNHRSPDKPFKPVPDGFKIHPSRRTLPKA